MDIYSYELKIDEGPYDSQASDRCPLGYLFNI